MSSQTISLAPPNSIIFVVDPTAQYEIPDDVASTLVAHTDSCISIGTLAEMDGETTITLGQGLPAGKEEVFCGELQTPGHEVAVIDSSGSKLLSKSVGSLTTGVRIYVNDSSEPDLISIEIL